MFAEEHPIQFPGGIHGGTMEALAPYGQHGLTIDGLDPADRNNWKQLTDTYGRQPEATVQIGVNHPDEQVAQDLGTIARRTIQQGRSLWNGKVPPPEAWNGIANQIRQHESGVTSKVVEADGLFNRKPDSQRKPEELHQGYAWDVTKQLIPYNAAAPVSDRARTDALYPIVHDRMLEVTGGQTPPYGQWWYQREKNRGWQKSVKQMASQMAQHPDIAPLIQQAQIPNTNLQADPDNPNPAGIKTLTPGTYEKTPSRAVVTGDMSVISKWTVVSLGELQQPGGVGATQEYNPVVDGPNPQAQNITDNANNSPEQEAALQTWVNMAVDKLNRGEQPDAILAQLAHDGCPEPEKVLQRAQSQPDTQPVSDEAGQNPFEVPTTPDPSTNGQMESLSQQPPVLAATEGDLMTQRELKDTPRDLMEQRKLPETEEDLFNVDGSPKTDNSSDAPEFKDEAGVQDHPSVRSSRVRIAGTTMTGTEIDRWEDMWGEGSVKIALDEGGTVDVAPSVVEPLADGQEPKHAVTDIQKFIDSMPEVQPTRPYIQARLNNLELVRRAVRSTISKVGFSDQQRLEKMDREAADESALLNEVLNDFAEGYEIAYAKSQPKFAYDGFNIANVRSSYSGFPREAGAIWATENFESQVADRDSYVSAAAHYAQSKGMTGEQFKEFLAAADATRIVRTEEFTPTETEDNDGPADQLFL